MEIWIGGMLYPSITGYAELTIYSDASPSNLGQFGALENTIDVQQEGNFVDE